MRKLINKLLSLLILMPSMAFALGLGDIRLNSALNQPLDAEISLLSVKPNEGDSIEVAMASYEDFARTGIDRPAVLMFIKFKVQQRGDGSYYIHLFSREPIREPFLDFLLDVNFRTGRLLREYTVLLDPPNIMQQAASQVSAPAAMGGATMPMTGMDRGQTQAAPGMAAGTMTRMQGATGAIHYGPVKKNDTLWNIAKRVRPDQGVSEQQVMIALLKANPEAFADNNINRLKKGYVLRIDDPAMIRAMSRAEAAREVSRQTLAWEDYKQRVAGEAAMQPAREATPQAGRAVAGAQEPRLKLVAPSEEDLAKAKAEQGGTRLGESAAAMGQDANLAKEMLEVQKRENLELRARLKELETQMASMQRLLELKDTDMAALQRQLRGEAPAAASAPVKAEPAVKETPVVEAEAPLMAEAAKPASEPAEVMPAEPVAEEKPAAPAKPQPVKKPVVVPPPEPVDPLMGLIDELLADPITLGGMGVVLLAVIGLVVVIIRRRGNNFSESILSGGATSLVNKKTGEGAPSEESSLFSDLAISGMNSINADDSDVDPLTEADVYMAYGRHQQAEELLADAMKSQPERADIKVKMLELYYNTKNRNSFEALVAKHSDNLQEDRGLWDKVLGMGHDLCPGNTLFSEAPAVDFELPEMGEKDAMPANDVLDIGIDLDALAEDMESGAEGDDFDLGVDLSDFGDTGDEDLGADFDLGDETDEESDDMDFDLGDLDLGGSEEPATEAAVSSDDNGMDFDLGDLDLGGSEEPATEAAVSSDDNGMDFDLGDLDLGGDDKPAAAVAVSSDDNGMDFDLGDLDLGGDDTEKAAPAEAADDNALDFDMSGLDLGSDEAAETETATAEDDLGMDFDLGDLATADETSDDGLGLNFEGMEDMGMTEAALESDSSALDGMGDFNLDLDDTGLDDDNLFGDLDEMGTKLDLAQAYIEMGDADGAKSIIDEVLEDGNDEQKQQAQELLAQLS